MEQVNDFVNVPIYKCPMPMRMRFLRRVFVGMFLELAIALSITYLSMQSRLFYHTMTKYIVLDIALFVICVILLIVYKMGQYETWGLGARLFVLVLVIITITSILSFTASVIDSHLLIWSTMRTSGFIFILAIYTLQPWFGYSTFIASLLEILMTIIAGVVLVYEPHRDFFALSPIEWFSPPQNIGDIVAVLLMSCAFDLYFLYLLHDIMGRVTCTEYLHANFLLIFDLSYGIIIVWIYTSFLCKKPSKNPQVDAIAGKVIDTVSLVAAP